MTKSPTNSPMSPNDKAHRRKTDPNGAEAHHAVLTQLYRGSPRLGLPRTSPLDPAARIAHLAGRVPAGSTVPVSKAAKPSSLVAVFDSSHKLIGVLDAAKLNKTAKAGDQAVMDQAGMIVGYASEKDVQPIAGGPPSAEAVAKALRVLKGIRPVPPDLLASTAPTADSVRRARELVRSALAGTSQLRWASDVLRRHVRASE